MQSSKTGKSQPGRGEDAALFGRFITSFDEANIENAICVNIPIRWQTDHLTDINPGGKEQE